METDCSQEELISLAEAAKMLPRRRMGKRPHVATLYRWSVRGVRGVRLETCQVGSTRCTSRQALTRFIQRLSQQSAVAEVQGNSRLFAERSRDSEAAGRQLETLGIGVSADNPGCRNATDADEPLKRRAP